MFNLQNIIGDIVFYQYKSKKHKLEKYALLIVNKCNNITISDNFNPIIPEKLYYLYDDILTNDIVNKNKLAEFLDGCPEADNPVFFNVLKYMGNPSTDYSMYSFLNCKLSRYMKMNDKVFSFYMDETPFTFCPILAGLIVINIILSIIATVFIITKIIIGIIIVAGIFLLLNILYIIYCCKGFKEILRMDIIYSNNFDKLFIGLVNYKEEKYLKTFSFDINNIEKFILNPYKNCCTEKLMLKVIYKNNDSLYICSYSKESKLEPLLYILNEKINKI